MIKTLDILKSILNRIKINNGDYHIITKHELEKYIEQLEDLMKSKSCDTCEHLMDRLRICHKKVQLHDGSLPNNFYCSRYETKE